MYPPQGTKCTMWETLNLHRYSGLSKTETSSRQGNHINVHIHIIANSKEICVLASFISLKQLIGLVFRLHILSDTWLHYWPFVLCEIQKQRWCISQKKKKKKILNLRDTENTEHMRFKARLYLLTVSRRQQKQHNIECHEISYQK